MPGLSGKWFSRKAATVLLAVTLLWAIIAPSLADALVVERRVESADAIFVLSGAADHVQRAQGAALAFRQGLAPRVILTDDDQRGGWDDAEKGNPYFVERTAAELIRSGVPAEAIERLAGKVYGTREEARSVVRTAAERGYRRILIVTSGFHSRRALCTFDRAVAEGRGEVSVGLMVSPSGAGYPNRYTWWLTPRGWRTVGAEYVKFGYYWLF